MMVNRSPKHHNNWAFLAIVNSLSPVYLHLFTASMYHYQPLIHDKIINHYELLVIINQTWSLLITIYQLLITINQLSNTLNQLFITIINHYLPPWSFNGSMTRAAGGFRATNRSRSRWACGPHGSWNSPRSQERRSTTRDQGHMVVLVNLWIILDD